MSQTGKSRQGTTGTWLLSPVGDSWQSQITQYSLATLTAYLVAVMCSLGISPILASDFHGNSMYARAEWLSRFPSQAVYGSLWSSHTERLGLRCVHVVVSAETGQPFAHRRTGGVDDTLVLIWAGLPFKCLEGEVSTVQSQRQSHGVVHALGRDIVFIPRWFRLLGNGGVFFLVWRIGRVIARRILATRRMRRGSCPRCGYDLRGNLDAGCPECGWNREEAEA